MLNERELSHPIVGPYRVVKRKSCKGIRLRVERYHGITISLSPHLSYREATRFLDSKLEWVIDSLNRQRERVEREAIQLKSGAKLPLINGSIVFIEEREPLELPYLKRAKRVTGEELQFQLHYSRESSKEELVKLLYKGIRAAAKAYLPHRCEELAALHSLTYNRVALKNGKTLWGSCSSLNNINLNINLVRLSNELIDYIILHELAHLKHKNHSREFHSYLETLCCGEAKRLSSLLREESPTIIVTFAPVD